MYGVDISKWQKGIDTNALSRAADFCIIKATEGRNYTDSCFYDYARQIQSTKMLIGCYHFARPDVNNSPDLAREEAVDFVNAVKSAGLLGKAILALDWETQPLQHNECLRAWLDKFISLTGFKPFIYASRSILNNLKTTCYEINDLPMWVASWPSIESIEVGKGIEVPSYINGAAIWQYSSNGHFSGFNGRIDLDESFMTKDEWLTYAGGEHPKVSTDLEWAQSLGYIPKDVNPPSAVSWNDLASTLRKYIGG